MRSIKIDFKKFIKMALRNIEYLANSIPEEIIEEISYKVETKNIEKGDYLFRVGTQWKEIYIVCMGRFEIMISNRRHSSESYLETLYAGWVPYSTLSSPLQNDRHLPKFVKGGTRQRWFFIFKNLPKFSKILQLLNQKCDWRVVLLLFHRI